MNTLYETDRLYLQVLAPTEPNAKKVLRLYDNNRDRFEPYELDRQENFYTVGYQLALLQTEYNLFVKGETVRFFLFLKNDPDTIIGTVAFHEIKKSFFHCCDIGYKLDVKYESKGFATEALMGAMGIMHDEYSMHRINAYVIPSNERSLKLLSRIGYVDEGLQKDYIFMHGVWQDHEHLTFIFN
ncbi:MAG: GNAT family N-acetyltransferase [Lachnospiraceae bacterium]|nr:GNAT family N-acetyltransferase [Lachnospiraceae bacterium]